MTSLITGMASILSNQANRYGRKVSYTDSIGESLNLLQKQITTLTSRLECAEVQIQELEDALADRRG